MPLTIHTLNALRTYFEDIMNTVEHPADKTNEIVLTLAGVMIWKCTSDVTVEPGLGTTDQKIEFSIRNKRFLLAPNTVKGTIELREKTRQGITIAHFNNHSSAGYIKRVFSGL